MPKSPEGGATQPARQTAGKLASLFTFLFFFLSALALGALHWSRHQASARAEQEPAVGGQEGQATPAPGPSTTAPPGKAPRVWFDRGLHDFGHQKQKLRVVNSFKIRNDGELPLKLGEPQVSCKCTKAELSQTELAPAQEGRLNVTLETGTSVGAFTYTVTTPTNDPRQPEVKVALKVFVHGTVDFYPELLNFGKVGVGSPKVLTLALRHPEGKPFEVLSAESSRPEFTVLSLKPNEAKTAYFLEVQALARPGEKTVAGFLFGMLSIRTDLEPTKDTQVKLILQAAP